MPGKHFLLCADKKGKMWWAAEPKLSADNVPTFNLQCTACSGNGLGAAAGSKDWELQLEQVSSEILFCNDPEISSAG